MVFLTSSLCARIAKHTNEFFGKAQVFNFLHKFFLHYPVFQQHGPDRFWKRRRLFMMTSHLYGRARNCYYVATRYNIRQLQHTRSVPTQVPNPQSDSTIWDPNTTPFNSVFILFYKYLAFCRGRYDEDAKTFPDRYLYLRTSREARKLDVRDLWDARVEGQAKELNYNTWLVH